MVENSKTRSTEPTQQIMKIWKTVMVKPNSDKKDFSDRNYAEDI